MIYAEDNGPLTLGNLHGFLNLLYGNCAFKNTAKWKHVTTVKKGCSLTRQGLRPGPYAEMLMVDSEMIMDFHLCFSHFKMYDGRRKSLSKDYV